MKKNNTALPVWLYLSNIVGYIRVLLLIAGLCVTQEHPLWGGLLLAMSGLLDMLDGFLARKLNQSSGFGAILDYALDRATAACFFGFVAFFYPFLWVPCTLLLSLDIISHLFHLQASHLQDKTSHKNLAENDPWILRMYYGSKCKLALTCLIHDLFLGSLFFYKFYPTPFVAICAFLLFPGFLFKTIVHITKIVYSSSILIKMDKP